MAEVLARRSSAFSPRETEELLRERLGGDVLDTRLEYATFTVWVAPEAWSAAARLCRDERVLAYDYFDCLFGVDAKDEGFDVVVVLYSTSTGNRICLRTRCPGGREAPTCESITDVYRGADWMERETWDMFGIEFTGHPGLEPRILTVENFEGHPLRKDFHLAARVAKPWPGVKEPVETDEEGNVIERTPRIGDAPGPYDIDKAMAEQAKLANPDPAVPEETEAETEEGERRASAAQETDTAADSGEVVPGELEQTAEDHEEDAEDAEAAEARRKADDKRKAAAEARRRKAEERARQAEGAEPEDDAEQAPAEAESGEGDAESGDEGESGEERS